MQNNNIEKEFILTLNVQEAYSLTEFLNDYFVESLKNYPDVEKLKDYVLSMSEFITHIKKLDIPHDFKYIEVYDTLNYGFPLTKIELNYLTDFLAFDFIDYIRKREEIDNIEFISNICDIWKKLEKLSKE